MSKPPGWNVKPPVKIPKSELEDQRNRLNFRPEKYDALINQQGVRVKVFRTTFCPNVKSIDGGEHEIDCQLCKGSGFTDARPIQTMAVLDKQSLEKKNRPEGYVDGTKTTATFLQGIGLQYFTLVELLDFTDIFIERIKRQRGSIDVLKYPAICVHLVKDSSGKEYFQGNDFTLDVNGSISWLPGRGPDAGVIYSLNYDCKVQFRAIEALHVNRFVQVGRRDKNVEMVHMNEQWVLQREYLVDRKDFKGNRLTTNVIRNEDED